MARICVIGTINKDLILPYKGAPIESFGGIFYTTGILAYLAAGQHEIVPVSFVGEDVAATLKAVLKQLPGVRTDGLIPLEQKNHKVILEYQSLSERREKALFNFPPLEWVHLEPWLDADFFIVNLITGWDLSLEAYLKLSDRVRERLYTDIHYLVMGVDGLGRRFPRKVPEADRWLGGARFVQMNQREFEVLAEGKRDESEFFQAHLAADQVLLITRGGRGTVLLYHKQTRVRRKAFAAYHPPQVVDTTGCGDAFGAGFVHAWLEAPDLYRAVDFANRVGAANASLPGTNEMHRLKEVLGQLKPSPGAA